MGLVISAGILGFLICAFFILLIEIAVEYLKTNGIFELSLIFNGIRSLYGLVFLASWIWLSGLFLKHSVLKRIGFWGVIIFLTAAIVPYSLAFIFKSFTIESDNSAVEISKAPLLNNKFATGDRINVITDKIEAEIDTMGGDIRQLKLFEISTQGNSTQTYQLLLDNPNRFHIAQSGLIGDKLPTHLTKYSIVSDKKVYRLAPDEDILEVKLISVNPSPNITENAHVTKIFRFQRGSYHIDIEYVIGNEGIIEISPFAYFQLLHDSFAPNFANSTDSYASHTGPIIFTEDGRTIAIKYSDLDQEKDILKINRVPNIGFKGSIGMKEQNFLAIWVPEENHPREFFAKKYTHDQYTAGVILPVGNIAPGQYKKIKAKLFVGFK